MRRLTNLERAQNAAKKLFQVHGKDALVFMLKRFSVAKVSELAPWKLPHFVARCAELLK